MKAQEQFHVNVMKYIQEIHDTQQQAIAEVARVLADCIQGDHLIYVVGSGGHSYIIAEDMFSRAGGLVPVFPVFDPGIPASFGARRSTALERMHGYMTRVLNTYPFEPGDVLIIGNAYGINAATIDSALWAKEHGITSIAFTSPTFSKSVPSDHPARHPSGKNLFEIVDYFVDCRMPTDDAVVKLEGFEGRCAPVSTILNSYVVQSVVAATAEELLRRGIRPPIWVSANIPGGDEANREYLARYSRRVRFL